MNFVKGLMYLLTFSAVPAHADTKYVFLDGGTDATSNYYNYYNEVRRGYETVKSLGKNAQVFAKDGTWKLFHDKNETLSNFTLTNEARKSAGVTSTVPSYPP